MAGGQLSLEDRLRINETRLKKNNLRFRETIKELKEIIKSQDFRIKELEAKLEDKEQQRQKLLEKIFKKKNHKENRKKPGKEPGAKGYQRPAPNEEDITQEYEYSLKKCPCCRKELNGQAEAVIKYEEDIVIKPQKTVKRYFINRYWCKHCQNFVKSDDIPAINRIGKNVMAYVLYSRYRLRLPYNKIQQSLLDLHDFKISEGEIANELEKAKVLFKDNYEALKELIKTANAVYCDETGWRMQGENWYIWVFVTEEGLRYVIEDTRGKGVAEKALGDKTDRILISDFYGAYTNLPGDKQKCWVHLLRDSEDSNQKLHKKLLVVYEDIKKLLRKKKTDRDISKPRDKLTDIVKQNYPEKSARRLQKRIDKFKDDLLGCLKYDGVLPENNTAERSLRNQVVMRKIFGGSRSLKGVKVHEVNSSVIDSLLLNGGDFFDKVLPILNK
ncbi:MAG: IS66 family transposase [Nanoarchaeota archaeon]|nr:IS66 family transposase [Nanoarchaeota archaeon]